MNDSNQCIVELSTWVDRYFLHSFSLCLLIRRRMPSGCRRPWPWQSDIVGDMLKEHFFGPGTLTRAKVSRISERRRFGEIFSRSASPVCQWLSSWLHGRSPAMAALSATEAVACGGCPGNVEGARFVLQSIGSRMGTSQDIPKLF